MDVGKQVNFGESEGGGQKGNSDGGGDGGSGNEDDDKERKDGKGDDDEAAVNSFLGKIVQGYSHRDPENHQSNISCINEEIFLCSKLETKLSDTRKVETRSFLYGPPKCLGDVEKARLPLQNVLKGSSRRRAKAETDATTDGSLATAPSAQPLLGTNQSERISDALNFPAPLYTLFLQLQSYLDSSRALVEECSGFLVYIEYSDEGSDGGGPVKATRLLRRSRGEIITRILLPEVPGLFSPSSSGVHDVTIRLQHLLDINVVVVEATGGGDHVDCFRLLTNIFPYDDGTSLPNESSASFSTMEDNSEDNGVEGALVNSKAGPYQLDCISEALADGTSLAVLIAGARILQG